MIQRYDYYKEYPKSRRNSFLGAIMILVITNLCLVLSKFHIALILFSIIFNVVGLGIMYNINKNQIITFGDHQIVIEWFTLFKNINQTVFSNQINKIQFKVSYERTGNQEFNPSTHTIIINSEGKSLKIPVTPVQYYDLMQYFKEFCDHNEIKMSGYEKEEE